MSEDYKRGFKEGFDAGYKTAERQFREKNPQYAPLPYVHPATNVNDLTCSVCGRYQGITVMGYVCPHPKCPTKATAQTFGQHSTME